MLDHIHEQICTLPHAYLDVCVAGVELPCNGQKFFLLPLLMLWERDYFIVLLLKLSFTLSFNELFCI